MSPGGSNRLLRMSEAAAYLNVPYRTLANCWKPWGITAHHIGRRVMFRERDLERYIESRKDAA